MKKGKRLLTLVGLMSLVTLFVLSSCNGDQTSSSSTPSSTVSETSSETGSREVKTYINWSFDNLEIGDEIPNTASEGAGFEAYRKDENGNVWVRSKNPSEWAAIYFGIPNENGEEIFLKDFAVETVAYLPSNNDGLSNDGGIPLLVGPVGRYDAAIYFGDENASVNLWHAGNTDGGPIATTQDNEDWGYRGSKVESLALYTNIEYKITVAGKYQGMTEDGDEFWTLFVFIEDRLVIEQKNIAYWTGGFGLRGWQSAIEYSYIKVTDFPLVCPDGIDHYNGETGGDFEIDRLETPTVTLEENVISWNEVEGALGYQVLINDKVVANVEGTTYTLTLTEVGEYEITVRAKADGKTKYFSLQSEEILYIIEPKAEAKPLATPIVVKTDSTYTWDAVDNAAKYLVVVNDKEFETTETSFTYKTGLPDDYEVKVKALASGTEHLDSEFSNPISFTVEPGTQKVYLNWSFEEHDADIDMPFVAQEGDGFKVVSIDDRKWVTSKNTGDWSAVYFGVSDEGSEVFLKDFMIQSRIKVPTTSSAADGGFCLFVGAEGRYDAALYLGGAGSSINIWKARDTDNGPKASTQKNETWGDLGSKVEGLNLVPGEEYVFTIIIESDEGGETFTLYAFIDNVLCIEKSGIPAMEGGFGLRAWQSSMMYDNILITALPTLCPDGEIRFN